MRRGLVALALFAAGLFCGCGNGASFSDGEIRSALETLPHRFDYRDVAHTGGSVVAGTASLGRHRVYFAVLSGNPKIQGRAVPRQPLPGGGFQRGVDSRSGQGFVTKYVYYRTSIPAIPEEIDTALCLKATDGDSSCRGL
jgi:hypothetical protein